MTIPAKHVPCCVCGASVLVSINASERGQRCNDCIDRHRKAPKPPSTTLIDRTLDRIAANATPEQDA